MSIESLQSQIETLRERSFTLGGRNGEATLHDYHTLVESLEEMTASAAQELLKARAEIDAERQSYHNLFRFAQDGYFVTDLQGTIRETNIIGGVLLGMPENELTGTPLISYVRVKERPAFSSHMARLNESMNFHKWETVFISDPKQEINAAITASTIRDYQGNVSGLRWLVRDITQRRQVEERLRRNTGQLIESQQIGHVGSWEWDVERNEVTWSDEMYRIHGLEPQSVKMTYDGFLAFIHPEDQMRVRAAIENSFKTRQPFSFDHRIIRSSGTVRHLHAQGIVLLDGTGLPARAVGAVQDVTERKRAEEQLHRLNFELEQGVETRTQELRDANKRLKRIVIERAHNQESIQELNRELNRRVAELQAVLNVLPVGVSVSYDIHAEHVVTNPAGKQIMSISQNETPSEDGATPGPRPFKVLQNGQEVPREDRPLRYAMAHNVFVRDAELEIDYEDGTLMNLLAYASPLYDEQDQVRGGVAAFIDITKRKTVERRLAVQYAVARVLAESNGIDEASLKVLEAICTETGWEFGAFWIFDHDAHKFYAENIWQKPGASVNELADATRKLLLSPGEGLPGTVYLTNTLLWLSDHSTHPESLRKDVAIKNGLNSVVLFPMRRGEGEVLGVMEFFGHNIQQPSSEMIDMFDALASQVGEFLERKYAENLRIVQMRQQAVVTRLSKRALLSMDLQELLDEACAQIAQTLSVNFCDVLELIPEKQQLLLRAGTGWDESMMRSTLKLEPGSQFLYILSENRPISVVELSKEHRFQAAPILTEHEIVSGMSVVIPGRARAFGLLEAYSAKRRIFTQDDVHFLQGMAHVLAAAIQHHRVEEALRLSRNQISVILGGIADGITAQNKQGQLIYANDAAARIIGYANTAELMSTPLDQITSKFKLFDESGMPLSLDQLPGRLALRGESSLPMTIRFKVLETGDERWSVVKSQAVTNEAGEVMMAVNIFHDITDL
jgi:PAS domain S-box-containing protein